MNYDLLRFNNVEHGIMMSNKIRKFSEYCKDFHNTECTTGGEYYSPHLTVKYGVLTEARSFHLDKIFFRRCIIPDCTKRVAKTAFDNAPNKFDYLVFPDTCQQFPEDVIYKLNHINVKYLRMPGESNIKDSNFFKNFNINTIYFPDFTPFTDENFNFDCLTTIIYEKVSDVKSFENWIINMPNNISFENIKIYLVP